VKVIQKLKIQKGLERNGIHPCEDRNTVVSSIIPFQFVLHLKKHLAGQKFHEDEKAKNEDTTRLCAQAVEWYDIGIQNLVPRLNKCLDKGGDYVANS
jgi:hypothetical protein